MPAGRRSTTCRWRWPAGTWWRCAPSGSGKSTLLAVLAGLEPPDEGEVRFEGRDLHGLPSEQRRALRRGKIALVLQAYGLLAPLTARENVELAQRVGA